MADHYTMPEGRTYCGKFRCCREQGHQGSCEIDITYLEEDQLQAIRDSAQCTAITYGGTPIIVRCEREAGHPGSHATGKELQHSGNDGIVLSTSTTHTTT